MPIIRPTILQIVPELETGGAELSAIEITEAIVKGGGRALVLSEGGRLAPRIGVAGGEFVPFAAKTKNPIRIAFNGRAIAKLIREEGVDLVHARSRAPAWSALRAAKATGRPFVTTYHGAYSEKSKPKRLYNSVMARGDLVIANSEFTAELIQQRYGTNPELIRVIHRGVDITKFDPAMVSKERIEKLAQRWSVVPGQMVVLHPARLTSWKGQKIVIEAAEILARDRSDLVFILAGDAQGRGGYVAELEVQIAAAKLQDRVRLVGHCDDMPAAFALAATAIIASIEPEAFGRTAAEAQAMGCPVIATAIGAPQETVLPAGPVRTGWLVAPRDATALAGAIRDALALSNEALAEIGTRARARVVEQFSAIAMQRKTLAVYDSLLQTDLETRFLLSTRT